MFFKNKYLFPSSP